jgi:hypothetical protein
MDWRRLLRMTVRLATIQALSTLVLLNFYGQSPAERSPIESILNNAEIQVVEYTKQFVDLASEETKSFQIFSTSGALNKSRRVRSVFFIHKPKDEIPAEFRYVIEVDRKGVERSPARIEIFFRFISAIGNGEKVRESIYEESLRYDIGVRVDGITLHPTPVLDRKNRPFFIFSLLGEDVIDGRRVFVIDYRQKGSWPFISVNKRSRSAERDVSIVYSYFLKDNVDYGERLVGKLWIDAETFQIWKEERELLLQPQGALEPFLFVRDSFSYRKSEFNILTPHSIIHEQYRLRKDSLSADKAAAIEFKYEPFTRPQVLVDGLRKPDELSPKPAPMDSPQPHPQAL